VNQETSQECLQPSANFRELHASDWLDAILESHGMLSAILAVIHPKLYDAGWQTTNRLRGTPKFGNLGLLDKWASVFSSVAIISNRYTPPHWDINSRPNWYDLLTTLGMYHNCNLNLPGLGVSLEYGPGMVAGIAGMVLEHEVLSFEGARLCHTYFMRDNVHEWAGILCRDWMHTSYYN
jgi:hypothetical protein